MYILPDGASPHTAKYTPQVFKDNGLYDYLFPWTAKSQDLNLIEGVWQLMKTRIHARRPRPQQNDTLRAAIQEEWEAINIQDLELLLTSITTRVQALLTAQGGHTRF